MNYYRRYMGDYLRDTSRLSMLEHGAYNLLLDYYYAEERPIPLDLDQVYRLVRAIMPDERRAVQKILTTYFRKSANGWHNERADEEIQKGTSAIARMAEAGKRGAETRWGKHMAPHAAKNWVPHRVGDAGGDAGGDASTNLQPPTASRQPPAGKACRSRKARRARERRSEKCRSLGGFHRNIPTAV